MNKENLKEHNQQAILDEIGNKRMKCCICRKEIEPVGTWTEGNNAQPVKDGRCCDVCNKTKVIPARLNRIG